MFDCCGPVHRVSRLLQLAASLLVAALVGCASSGSGGSSAPAREPVRLDVTVAAAARVNLDAQGRAAPVQLRVYELKTPASFEAADYFSLANNDKTVLQADLLSRQDYLLRPGDTQRLQRRANPDATAIGVLAGYRELDTSTWRAVLMLPEARDMSWMSSVRPDVRARIKVTADETGLRIQLVD